jgi:hypothetical protein
MFTAPTNTDFKNYFTRDFPFGSSTDTVMDSDIDKALAEAGFNFNEGLYQDQSQYTMAYLYLTAHYLVMDLRASSQGISGNYSWLSNSKAVGGVSEGITIPPRILENPYLAMISKTNYGAKYISLLLPQLVGAFYAVSGETQP